MSILHRPRKKEELENNVVPGESEQCQNHDEQDKRVRKAYAMLEVVNRFRDGTLFGPKNPGRVILFNPSEKSVIIEASLGSPSQPQNENAPFPDFLSGLLSELSLERAFDNDPDISKVPLEVQQVLESIPTFVLVIEEVECAACEISFEIGEEVKKMPCKHMFHIGCILSWLKLYSSCPICGFELLNKYGSKVKNPYESNGFVLPNEDGSKVKNSYESNNTDDGDGVGAIMSTGDKAEGSVANGTNDGAGGAIHNGDEAGGSIGTNDGTSDMSIGDEARGSIGTDNGVAGSMSINDKNAIKAKFDGWYRVSAPWPLNG